MAYSIAKAIQKSVAGYNRPGGRASANHSVKKVSGRGNKGSFGNAKNSKRVKSINSGGNYGTLGY